MSAPLFGTDGVRGVANADLTPELAYALGRAGASVLAGSDAGATLVIGRDTRLSGTMLEAAVSAGIASTGCDVLGAGVVPTPGVACIVRATGARGGVVISASHNPVEDNGIKFFGADGFKLDDERERAIEALVRDGASIARPTHLGVGIVREARDLTATYFDALVGAGGDLSPLTIVVDAAFGAAYAIGPHVLATLGATVLPMDAEDDGARINVGCGSTDLHPLMARVRELAHEREDVHVVGVAFDGDADRALFVDEKGERVDGDRVMLALAREKKRLGRLAGDTVVGTVMSNIGLERALAADGIALARAAVGDRYVLEVMRAGGYTFGGEQSGHLIDLERNTTGDGVGAAVALFTLVASSGRTLHDLVAGLTVAPQILLNVRAPRAAAEDAGVREAVAEATLRLGTAGRILVRASGTEPLVRVMVEGDDAAEIDAVARAIAGAVERAAGVRT